MIRKFLSGGALVIALAAPAWAQEQCVAPKAPVIPDGAKATPNQIIAAQNEIKAYAAAADNYQSCLAQEIARQRAAAAQNSAELDPSLQSAVQVKSTAQKSDAQQVAAAWGAAVEAFNKAQQRKQRQPASAPSASGGAGYGGGGYGGGMGRY
jgi:hypothetical protein